MRVKNFVNFFVLKMNKYKKLFPKFQITAVPLYIDLFYTSYKLVGKTIEKVHYLSGKE